MGKYVSFVAGILTERVSGQVERLQVCKSPQINKLERHKVTSGFPQTQFFSCHSQVFETIGSNGENLQMNETLHVLHLAYSIMIERQIFEFR